MKPHPLFSMLLLSAPALLFAQVVPEPKEPVIAQAPSPKVAPTAPRAPMPIPRLADYSEAPPTPEPAQTPKAPTAPKAPQASPPPPPPTPQGQPINIRIEVTLADNRGVTKTLSMTVADGENAMNRTTASGAHDFSFNADARPTIAGNKIRLRLTADAVVPSGGDEPGTRLGLRQSQTVIIADGETIEIARAADPVSERAFVMSVKVSIKR